MTDIHRSRLRKIVALVLPLLFIFIFAQEFLFCDRSYDTERLEQFYREEKNSIDVVLIGASEISQGYIPAYAYENYGFTSYMYTVDSNMGSLYLTELKEILKHQDPGLIIVDLSGFLIHEDSEFFNNIVMQNYLRGIPFSRNKLEAMLQYQSKDTLTYFFPLIMYHGHPSVAYRQLSTVYDRLTKEARPACLNGAITITNIHTQTGDAGVPFDPDTFSITDNVRLYLEDLLIYCRENNLDNVVFTNYPRKVENEDHYYLFCLLEQLKPIIEQYGYPVLNLQDEMETIGIDVNKDFSDYYHLNIYGQLKMTDYLSNLIINDYKLSPRPQTEANRTVWESYVANTREYISMALDAINAGNHLFIHETAGCWLYRQ